MIIVSNSGPLINLAKIGRFSLLKQLFGKIIIPEAVYIEVVKEGKRKPGQAETNEALGKWIEKMKVSDYLAIHLLLSQLKRGEAEAIVLAREIKCDLILLDDKCARDIAETSGLAIKGTLGILLTAKEMGIIKDLKMAIDHLIEKGFYLKEDIYQRILKET